MNLPHLAFNFQGSYSLSFFLMARISGSILSELSDCFLSLWTLRVDFLSHLNALLVFEQIYNRQKYRAVNLSFFSYYNRRSLIFPSSPTSCDVIRRNVSRDNRAKINSTYIFAISRRIRLEFDMSRKLYHHKHFVYALLLRSSQNIKGLSPTRHELSVSSWRLSVQNDRKTIQRRDRRSLINGRESQGSTRT